MKHFKRILGVLLIFAFGVIVGVAGTSAGIARKVRTVLSGGSKAVIHEVVERLDRELKFDALQKEQVLKIAEMTRLKLRESQAKIQPEVERTLGEAEEQVRTVLRADQVEKFDRLLRDRRERWRSKIRSEGEWTLPATPATPASTVPLRATPTSETAP
jgi:hypothetical protein